MFSKLKLGPQTNTAGGKRMQPEFRKRQAFKGRSAASKGTRLVVWGLGKEGKEDF